ncbi:hypothetical protein [Lacipirellula limnantheis]|uniref:Uncharacterized protein n=1 Tax=Lacipirellula limnantheis TaxID=2528024 RepID=A0A517TY32_9BACT|nr:hypothetical protein [Lacipirellula limnantheis]QDT73276.1 hypothetical protein I41_24650 [Lacipirellula limnantheis]
MQRMSINAAVCSPKAMAGEFQFVASTGGNIAEGYRRGSSLYGAQAARETLAAKYGWPPMMMDEPFSVLVRLDLSQSSPASCQLQESSPQPGGCDVGGGVARGKRCVDLHEGTDRREVKWTCFTCHKTFAGNASYSSESEAINRTQA